VRRTRASGTGSSRGSQSLSAEHQFQASCGEGLGARRWGQNRAFVNRPHGLHGQAPSSRSRRIGLFSWRPGSGIETCRMPERADLRLSHPPSRRESPPAPQSLTSMCPFEQTTARSGSQSERAWVLFGNSRVRLISAATRLDAGSILHTHRRPAFAGARACDSSVTRESKLEKQ